MIVLSAKTVILAITWIIMLVNCANNLLKAVYFVTRVNVSNVKGATIWQLESASLAKLRVVRFV